MTPSGSVGIVDPVKTLGRPGDVRLCYWSKGDGDPLVFLHGLAGSGCEWWPVAGEMLDEVNAVTVDQRGHGQSTRRPADLSRDAYVDDVAAVIESTTAGRPVTLVGQSMGAHTAMLTAARYPNLVDKLVMIEGGVGGGGQQALDHLEDVLARWPVPFPNRDSALAFFGGGPAAAVWAAGLEARETGLWPRFDLDVMVDTMCPIFQAPAWTAWTSLQQATLIVLGDSSSIDRDQIDAMARCRPDVQVKVIGAAGHDVHLDQPQDAGEHPPGLPPRVGRKRLEQVSLTSNLWRWNDR